MERGEHGLAYKVNPLRARERPDIFDPRQCSHAGGTFGSYGKVGERLQVCAYCGASRYDRDDGKWSDWRQPEWVKTVGDMMEMVVR